MRRYDYSQPVALNQWEQEHTDTLPFMLPRRYEVDVDFEELKNDYDWQITYKFPARARNNIMPNGVYGKANMTFRRLYLELVKLNRGVSFIDDYIEHVMPYSDVGARIREYLAEIKEAAEMEWQQQVLKIRRTKSGRLDRRYKVGLRRLVELRAFTNSQVKAQGAFLARLIKQDLIGALATGRVPLSPALVSHKTQQMRMEAGLNPTPRFYASGQFINSIQFYVRLEKKKTWQTDIVA